MSSLLEELGYIEEEGNIDSSLFNLEDLIFCNIPQYLDNTDNDNYFNSIKNYFYLDGKPIDGKTLYNKSDEIIDKILSGEFFDFTINGIENNTTNNYPFDYIKREGKIIDQKPSHLSGYKDSSHISNIKDTDNEKNHLTGFRKSAIIEFAADTVKWPHEEYELKVKPGDFINNETIIGYCKQDGEMKPIRSIFSKGIVRVDPIDKDFGRCAKTICHNHIIIDDYELAYGNSWDGINLKNLNNKPMLLQEYQVHQDESMDAFYLVTEILPYLVYLDLIDKKSKKQLNKKHFESLTELELIELGDKVNDEEYIKEHFRTREPEDEFSKFINEKYIPRKEKFIEDIKNHYGEKDDYTKNIKSTKGNIKKLKEFGEELLRIKNEYYNDIIEMCKNPGFDIVDQLDNHEETTKIQTHEYSYMRYPKYIDFIFEEYIKGKEGDSIGEQYEKGYFNQYKPIEKEMTFSEYYKNLARMIRGLDDYMFPYSKELKTILLEFSESHPKSGDARKILKKEIKTLNDFKDKIMSTYETYKIISIDNNDKVLKEMIESLPDEAKWPSPTDFEYNGEYFRKWTFPNIDAMYPKTLYDDNLNPINPIDHDYAPEGYKNVSIDDLKDIRQEPNIEDSSSLFMTERESMPFSEINPRTNERPGNIELSDINYWRKYLAIATIVTLPFLATGIYIAPSIFVQLPCIYIPLKVVNVSKVGLIIVVGLAIRGVSINVMLIYVNLSKDSNSVLLPATILLSDLKESYFDNIKSLNKMVPAIANGMINTFKSNNVALLKENKRYLAEMTALNGLQLPGKTDLEKSAKEYFKEDTRQIVIRLEEDAKRFNDKWNNLKESYTDFESEFKDLVKK